MIPALHASGGMERILSTKANYLVDAGYEVAIITTDQCGKRPFFALNEKIQCYDLGINYDENNGKSFLNKLAKFPIKQWKHKKRLTQLLSELKGDIVISMFCNDAPFTYKIEDGSKKLIEVHFSKFKRLQYDRKGLWALADRYFTSKDANLVDKYEKFIVLTNEDKGYWGSKPNIDVIANMITAIPEEKAELQNKKVIAIGRYTYQKGFDYLIDAWKIVANKYPEWQLDIIGQGELKEQLQQQILKNGLLGKVNLVPHTNQIEDVYLNSSVLAMTSRYEGLPMVLIEAASYGVPAVSFACKCGPAEIIEDGKCGYLVPEKDIEAFAEKLMSVMKNEELRKSMGERSKEIVRNYIPEAVMPKWIDLFNEITKE